MMRISPYLTAEQLKITVDEHQALVKTIGDLAVNNYIEPFSMVGWLCCVENKMKRHMDKPYRHLYEHSQALNGLFNGENDCWPSYAHWAVARPHEAAEAIHRFLCGVQVRERVGA